MTGVKLSAIQSGVAGEYMCAGELSRRGYIATLTLRKTKGVDILATNKLASKSISIQVKTHYGKSKMWPVSLTENPVGADGFFFVFVNLNSGGVPDYYIVPSKTVFRSVKETQKEYLSGVGRKGQKRKDVLPKFVDKEQKYLGRWELLGL